MKEFWQELCIQAYMQRVKLWALLVVVATWIVLAEWVVPKLWVDLVVYFAFGWFVLGEIAMPWVEQKLNKLFN